jgi:uncharacterized protein (TIGR00251 family)
MHGIELNLVTTSPNFGGVKYQGHADGMAWPIRGTRKNSRTRLEAAPAGVMVVFPEPALPPRGMQQCFESRGEVVTLAVLSLPWPTSKLSCMTSHNSTSVPAYLKATPDGALLLVKVQPRASRDEIGEALGGELKIRITAPPVDSAANEALVRFLAGKLGCSRGAIRILRGEKSRRKTLEVRGLPLAQIAAALG